MKVVVDTNILYSALLSSKGKIGDLIFNPFQIFQFHAIDFLKTEIEKHWPKLLHVSKIRETDLIERKEILCNQIKFINGFALPQSIILQAESLTSDIDPDDTLHVAATLYLKGILWTGDKKLLNGLRAKDFNDVMNTSDLWEIRNRTM